MGLQGFTSDHERKSRSATATLKSIDLTADSLLDLFVEWQSSKLKSVKKFLFTLISVILIASISGIEHSDLILRGTEIPESRVNLFLFSILVVLLISYLYYEFLRYQDWGLRNFQIKDLKNDIDKCEDAVSVIDSIIDELDPNASPMSAMIAMHEKQKAYETYKAIKIYRKKIKGFENKFVVIQLIERILITLLSTISLAFLITALIN